MRIGKGMAVLGAAVVVIGGGAGTAYAALSSSGPAYRLATVSSADVTATLNEVGNLTPAQQADVAFPVSGTVANVAVSAGQQVTAGQTLGTLDTSALKASLTSAESTLANANLKVSDDIASQDAAGASGAGPASSGTPSTSGSSTSSLRPLQQAVLSSQRQADAALALAKTALAQANQACGKSSPQPSPSPSHTAAAPGSPSPAPVSCAAATQQVLADETAELHDQQVLAGQLSSLAMALNQLISAAGTPAGGAGAAAQGDGGNGGNIGGDGGSISSGSGGNSGGPVGAAQLAADQAAADAASDQVTVAQQNLNSATVVSPLSGTVITVSATQGAAESAGSTAFQVAGAGQLAGADPDPSD